MAKFFNIEEKHMPGLSRLFRDKIDSQFIILGSANGFTDIAQYSTKYQNVRVITVRTENLDYTYRLV